MKEEEDLYS